MQDKTVASNQNVKKGDEVWLRARATDVCTSCLGFALDTIHDRPTYSYANWKDVSLAQPAADADKLLQEFGRRTNLDLSYQHGHEDEDGAWLVQQVNGGVNDREWTVIGRGETPTAAITEALASLNEGAKS